MALSQATAETALVPESGVDETLRSLRQMIADGTFLPGRRLPPERELARRLDINRRLLRKALGILADEGVISRQVGRGTFVGRMAFGPDSPVAEPATPMELIDARIALEPVIAAESALRARQIDLRRMRLCLKHGDAASGFEHFEEWDAALHRAIAEATQNPIFVMVTDTFGRMRSAPEWDRLKRLSLDQARRALYRNQHHAIVAAIAARDPLEASRAMRDHLATVRDALFGAVN
jgi:DNA-binding FadR family transcriptional regulator